MGRKKTADDDAKPDFEQVPLKVIAPDYWPEVERNKQNLIDAGLWFSILVVFEPQNDHSVATQDRVFPHYVPNSSIKHSKSDSKDRSQEIL
jgi:hypothetical protein